MKKEEIEIEIQLDLTPHLKKNNQRETKGLIGYNA